MADNHNQNPIVLDYHNTLLRLSDITLLDEPNWINDNIIGFAFEYFEKEQFSHCADLIGYISPSVTQAIKLSSAEEMGIFLDPLNLQQKQHIFMAVNDNMAADTHGGTHWSLLTYDCNTGEFLHYDSMPECNHYVAMDLSLKLVKFFPGSDQLFFKEVSCPKQENGYDCGMHVIATCEHLIRVFVEACMLTLDEVITPVYVQKKRKILKDLISDLKTIS